MKRILILFILILCIGFVIAPTYYQWVCPKGQVHLLYLENKTNARIALGNQSDVGGINFFTLNKTMMALCTTNRTCNANYSNAILWLSAQTNAYAAINKYQSQKVSTKFTKWFYAAVSPVTYTYKYPICTNDYVCTNRTSSCKSDEFVLLSLSKTSKSYVSDGDASGYNVKLCCKKAK